LPLHSARDKTLYTFLVLIMKFLRGVQHIKGCLSAEYIIRTENFMDIAVFQRLILEWRAGEMSRNFRTTGN
jgi:hypothetical protein